nr:SIS domain-containing protein [Conexibacter arvalis]
MAAEIAQTPAVVAAQLEGAAAWEGALRAALPAPLRGVALTARGSSDHAAAYGRYLLEPALGVPAWSTAPSLATRYDAGAALDGVLAIAVSQSGATPEIVTALERQAAGGATTVAIVNDRSSPLAQAADVVIPLGAGVERAVPATKTFTATLLAFALAAAAVDRSGRVPLDAAAVRAAVADCVADDAAVESIVPAFAAADVALHLGRGPLLSVAYEAALKLIETTGTAQLAWSTVDVRHGPMALATPQRPVLLQHAAGPVSADAAEIAAILAERGVPVHVVGDALPLLSGRARSAGDGPGASDAAPPVASRTPVPGDLPEHLRPLVHAVRLQQLSLAVARARGIDPDQPVGLSKVTPTS